MGGKLSKIDEITVRAG